MRITQAYNLLLKELIVSSELQFDLNQLFTVINALDKDNLKRPGSVFDWGNTKLNNVNDPLGEMSDTTDLQVAVTKNYLKAKFFGTGGRPWYPEMKSLGLSGLLGSEAPSGSVNGRLTLAVLRHRKVPCSL